jgi:hypothetical protein
VTWSIISLTQIKKWSSSSKSMPADIGYANGNEVEVLDQSSRDVSVATGAEDDVMIFTRPGKTV